MNIRWNLSGMEIERESFRVIESECDLHKWMPAPEWRVARRLIHTTADMSIADTLVFRHDAIGSGLRALRAGAPIFCDSKMIRAGLSIERLKRLNPGYGPESLHCHISDQDVIDRAKLEGPRLRSRKPALPYQRSGRHRSRQARRPHPCPVQRGEGSAHA